MPTQSLRRSASQIGGHDIVIEAAWLYYQDGLNQNEIAARFKVSRATVVNYLQEARERGYVQITLSPEAFKGHEAALQLREKYGLREAYVVPDGNGEQRVTEIRVARGAAQWLPRLVSPGDRLGVAWGKTIYDVAEFLETIAVDDLTVLQLVGSMATPYGFSADVCSSYVARKFSARCVNLHVPAMLSSPEVARALRAEDLIASQLDEISHFNKTLFAVGSCTPDSHVVSSGVATIEELNWYIDHGAVGVLCGRFINEQGDGIEGPLDERMMGIALNRMRNPETGILVSVGSDRVPAAIAALRGGYATHIVTNQSSAEAILSLGG